MTKLSNWLELSSREQLRLDECFAGDGGVVVAWRNPQNALELHAVDQAGDHTIGRLPGAAIFIDHPTVSREHATIRGILGHWKLIDADSRNGTKLPLADIERPIPHRGISLRHNLCFLLGEARIGIHAPVGLDVDPTPYVEGSDAAPEHQVADLSSRQREVLFALCSPMFLDENRFASNAEIASELTVEAGTVKDHLDRIGQKWGVHGRTRRETLGNIAIAGGIEGYRR